MPMSRAPLLQHAEGNALRVPWLDSSVYLSSGFHTTRRPQVFVQGVHGIWMTTCVWAFAMGHLAPLLLAILYSRFIPRITCNKMCMRAGTTNQICAHRLKSLF